MNQWHVKHLGDAMLADEAIAHIKTAFVHAHAAAGGPTEMAIFIRHASEGRLHCEVRAYFAPAAAVIAQKFGGTPCSRPSPDNLGLLVGSEDAWGMLFPKS